MTHAVSKGIGLGICIELVVTQLPKATATCLPYIHVRCRIFPRKDRIRFKSLAVATAEG